MTDHEFAYVGEELDVFSKAINWKTYWKHEITPYMGKTVLEVGAGIGGTTRAVCDDSYRQWLGLEPDADMFADLLRRKAAGEFPDCCEFHLGTIATLAADQQFESIIYIDVLEHIENDADELVGAVRHLQRGGHLIVLSPAYQWLYSPFDKAIGHYRRYTRRTLSRLQPPGCDLERSFYLDSLGLLISAANKLMLRASLPTESQIHFWDSTIVPLSKRLDPLIQYSMGRSIINVWKRTLSDK